MRTAYTLLGLLFLIIGIAGALAFRASPVHPSSPAPRIPTGTNPHATSSMLSLTSSAFEANGLIPARFTCDGVGVNPPLTVSGVPQGAVSLVLIMDDPDVPKALRPAGVFDHWILFNIPPTVGAIAEGESVGISGANSRGALGYTGPCPPTNYQPTKHRYIFVLYALDSELSLAHGATKDEVLAAMKGHVLGQTQLIGLYERPQ